MNDVTVVIPTYNRAQMLRESISSVRMQSYQVKEIIVVDDGSTDETESWCAQQKDVILLHTDRVGPSKARNVGAHAAASQWIAFLDSDDVWLPDHIETLIAIALQSQEINWVVANSIVTDVDLNPHPGVQGFALAFPLFQRSLTRFHYFFPRQSEHNIWQGDARKHALKGNFMQPSGLMIKNSFFKDLKGFDENLIRCEDMDFLLRMTKMSQATLSFKQTYLWRQGQTDSLAADKFALLLKRGALAVLLRSGIIVARGSCSLICIWLLSYFQHLSDYFLALFLRKMKRLGSIPWLQACLQTGVASLNMLLPILISRQMSQLSFGEYRTFGLYLNSSIALSLTSGFWSLLPYWGSLGDPGHRMISIAFRFLLVIGFVFSIFILLLTPFEGETSFVKSLLLCGCIFALLPSFFLEQNLCFKGHGFLAAVISAGTEIVKIVAISLVLFLINSLNLVFLLLFLFLLFRLIILWKINRKLDLLHKESAHVFNAMEVFKVAFPVGISSAIIVFSGVFDRFYLHTQISIEEFAIISAGFVTLPFVGYFEQSIFQKTLPIIALAVKENRLNDAISVMSAAIERISNVTVPITLIFYVFAEQIIGFLYDQRYASSVVIFKICSLLNLTACLPIDILLRAKGECQELLRFSLIQLGVIAFTTIGGYWLFGAVGAICASVAMTLLSRFLFLSWQLKRMGVLLCPYLYKSLNISRHAITIISVFLAHKIIEGMHIY